MANTFKHRKTGDVISVSRVRYFVDGRPPVDLSGTYDLSQYVEYNDETESSSFETIRVTKSTTDGSGIR